MPRLCERFKSETNGAVTVDWVVLTAGLIGLSIGVFVAIEAQSTRIVGDTAGLMSQQEGRMPEIQNATE